MKKTLESSNTKARGLIRSANEKDDIESQNDDMSSEDGADEFAPDGDTDGFDIDEDIVDEINENDDFGGEELAKEDIIDAIQVIDEIATAVTEKEGEDVTMDADTVLDKVEAFADDSVAENDIDDIDFGEDIPDELANSVVRVMVQDANNDNNIVIEKEDESIRTDVIDETPATVYDSDMDADDVELDEDDDSEVSDDLLVIGNAKSADFKKGLLRLNSSFARKNPIAWKKAYTKVSSAVLAERKGLTASDWALVQCIANAYGKEFSDKITNVKRVLSAVRKSEKLKSLLQSEIEAENKTDATATKPFDEEGATESDVKPTVEENVGSTEFPVDENIGDGQAGELDSQHGDPVVQTSTEEEKEGEISNDPTGVIELLTLPIENAYQTVVLRKVGKNTFVGCGYLQAKDKKISLVKSNKEIVASAKDNQNLTSILNGKVVAFSDGTAMLLKSSNLYGLLACHANFVKGIKGAEYDVFKKVESAFVNPKGVAITSSLKCEYIIASATSNKSAKKVQTSVVDVFASLEKSLHHRELVMASLKAQDGARQTKSIQSSLDEKDRKINALSAALRRKDSEIKRLEKLASGTEAQIRSQIAERDRQALFANSQREISEESRTIKNNADRNVDMMAKRMAKMF